MRHKMLLVLLFSLVSIVPIIHAQDETPSPDCRLFVQEILDNAPSQCFRTEVDQVCIGYPAVNVSPAQEGFTNPGNAASLDAINTIQTALMGFDAETQTAEWGVALARVKAGLAEDSELRYLLVGDVTLTNAPELVEVDYSAIDDPAPMQAFYVLTSTEGTECANTPNALIIQNPYSDRATININGVDVSFALSTIVVTASEAFGMRIVVLGGQIETNWYGERNTFDPGQAAAVQLGGDPGELIAFSRPAAARGVNLRDFRHLPISLLPQRFDVQATTAWTDTGIELMARQQFFVTAVGSSTLCSSEIDPSCDENPAVSTWVGPAGNLPIGVCTGTDGDCPLMPGVFGALIGQVGDGRPFLIASGGGFIADADGELRLGYNDATYDNNAGEYHVFVTIDGETAGIASDEPAEVIAPCTVTAINTANLRSGPGATHDHIGTLAIRDSADVIGQAAGADGFTWWQLEDESWLREDLVREDGECALMPVVEIP